ERRREASQRGGGSRAGFQRGDERAPVLVFGNARLALAEKQRGVLALRVEDLNRGDDAVDGRLANDPGARDEVLPQVEVEDGVEHVQPRSHHSDLLDGTGVNLNASGA